MKKLNNNQRKFLEYVRDTHTSIGWYSTIDTILKENKYFNDCDDDDISRLNIYEFLKDWRLMVSGVGVSDIQAFGKPFKYLK